MSDIVFQAKHSRNPSDWTYTLDGETGRHTLSANGKGVKRRCGLIITRLVREKMTIAELTESLSPLDPAITQSDVRHAVKRLIFADVIRTTGTSKNRTFRVTERGKKLWSDATKLFL